MRTIQTVADLRRALEPLRKAGKRIGFVPTMGALHKGHLSLVRLSKLHTDVTVVSIFVNPTQFGPNEDFEKYPRTVESDAMMLVDEGVEFLFLPDRQEMYPNGNSTFVQVDGISSVFEGEIRPTHFRGVATVVAKLFNAVQPDVAFFGQKDAQQVAVIKRMVRDLLLPIEITIGPTIRESDHLAMSSRNRYLNEEHRNKSNVLHRILETFAEALRKGDSPQIARNAALQVLERSGSDASLDYLELVDSETFQPVMSFKFSEEASNDASATIIIAARFGTTRLIDNLVIR